MSTYQKTIIVGKFIDAKPLIISEVLEEFRECFHCTEEDITRLTGDFSRLFDFFISYFSGTKELDFEDVGEEIVSFLHARNINFEEFTVFFDSCRMILENWVEKQPITELEKASSIATMNKFFLELLKAYTIEMNTKNEEDLNIKSNEIYQLQQERLQILSKLSNSFAHEIRNPLTSIKGFIQLLENRIEKPSNEGIYFDYINQEIMELEEQVNQILYLSNRKNHQDFNHHFVSLNELTINAVSKFQPLFNEHRIEVDAQLKKQIVIKGIEDQLKLALYKLIQNAIDALLMKDKDRKVIIQMNVVEESVVITVANNGPPIPAVIKKNIFDPFVSTKELGKGIGLAITKQIVEKHNGSIQCFSEGIWTKFNLTLPY
ncbi:HAMP domain-containing sensor histidine kinase [Evansella sp. AB-P1]|uniref:sensor histidine kinase n=1 Tax=Evansella sp. AB-P1 TaxID=3037653 RepID=UPI00241F6550|nr:HAMP domain-containing sensor histidine kinase [Evansella sp. AB-P1]MDG5786422.1 HAMP domain-containing sensor histidine kinase [Evansella sp. AB-P1]